MKIYSQIKSLLQVREISDKPIPGLIMNSLPKIDNAWLLVDDGLIKDFGSMDQYPELSCESENCEGKYILPAFVDPHTHLVFAASREKEFEMRIKGYSYEEIAQKGGGILNSALRLNETEENELFESALERLEQVIATGTGAIEIKSGYGLTIEGELKILRVIRRLKEFSKIPIKATFLGAHAYPIEFKNDHDKYLDILCERMIPEIAGEQLADYIDVFCERGYFNIDETECVIEKAAKFGLKAKLHVNQFSSMGGIQLAVKHNALSVDHLEVCSPNDIASLASAATIPTLLPGCSFFISIPYAPARELINANLPVALASDYNPGSTPSGNIPFVMSLACIKMKMTPEEVINACTLNSAAAIEMQSQLGSIAVGKRSNLILTKKMPSLAYWMYSYGQSNQLIDKVIIA